LDARAGRIRYSTVIAAISAREGLLGHQILHRAPKSGDVIAFLRGLLERAHIRDPGRRYALFMDNASIHKGGEMRNAESKLGVPIVYGVAWRADLSGIASFWDSCEHLYRTCCDRALSSNVSFDHERIIETALCELVPQNDIKSFAKGGWDRLRAARPIG